MVIQQPPPLPIQRQLDYDVDDGWSSYLLDRNGESRDPYSMAWRYLGMFMDCDPDDYGNDDDDVNSKDGRRLSGDSGDNCVRKLLWAAYYDPGYRGGSIGEYQFYDIETGEWDDSTCQTRRCARMDCHEPRTHWKLLGVFKESDGLEDWAEQLFKHEGVCVWNSEDTYEFMEEQREKWPNECTELGLSDGNGNTLYMHLKPLAEGNMTRGVYTDEDCTTESTLSYSDYVIMYYQRYYYYYNNYGQGDEEAAQWDENFIAWNEYMSTYKICQPCRAYSLNKESDDSNSKSNSGDRRLGDDNDGEGDNEQWGYDCEDEAGYLNCNQCYKFETKTDMEAADITDLQRAHDQDSIVAIKVEGKWYGRGGYVSPRDPRETYLLVGVCVFFFLAFLFVVRKQIPPTYNYLRAKWHVLRGSVQMPKSLHEAFTGEESGADRKAREDELNQQKDKIAKLQRELDEERANRYLEQNRYNSVVQNLRNKLKRFAKPKDLQRSEGSDQSDTSDFHDVGEDYVQVREFS